MMHALAEALRNLNSVTENNSEQIAQ
jgi:hypothetical protein